MRAIFGITSWTEYLLCQFFQCQRISSSMHQHEQLSLQIIKPWFAAKILFHYVQKNIVYGLSMLIIREKTGQLIRRFVNKRCFGYFHPSCLERIFISRRSN